MTAFYHMASEIKPDRGLTTKLTTDIPGRLIIVYERRRSQVFGSNNLPHDLCHHAFAAVSVFSDLNIDGCCDDHGVPFCVLSLLGSHDSVSLHLCCCLSCFVKYSCLLSNFTDIFAS